jgi:hypothetical protein
MSKLYEMKGGNVAIREIPKAGISLKISRRADVRRPLALPGAEDGEWPTYTLDQVTAIATQMTPWARWYASPRRDDDTNANGTSTGKAHIVQGTGWLSTESQATSAVSYALHEVMHLAEDFLTADERQAIDDGIVGVPDLPKGDWNRYYTSAIEIRANAFGGGHTAIGCADGRRNIVAGWPRTRGCGR